MSAWSGWRGRTSRDSRLPFTQELSTFVQGLLRSWLSSEAKTPHIGLQREGLRLLGQVRARSLGVGRDGARSLGVRRGGACLLGVGRDRACSLRVGRNVSSSSLNWLQLVLMPIEIHMF